MKQHTQFHKLLLQTINAPSAHLTYIKGARTLGHETLQHGVFQQHLFCAGKRMWIFNMPDQHGDFHSTWQRDVLDNMKCQVGIQHDSLLWFVSSVQHFVEQGQWCFQWRCQHVSWQGFLFAAACLQQAINVVSPQQLSEEEQQDGTQQECPDGGKHRHFVTSRHVQKSWNCWNRTLFACHAVVRLSCCHQPPHLLVCSKIHLGQLIWILVVRVGQRSWDNLCCPQTKICQNHVQLQQVVSVYTTTWASHTSTLGGCSSWWCSCQTRRQQRRHGSGNVDIFNRGYVYHQLQVQERSSPNLSTWELNKQIIFNVEPVGDNINYIQVIASKFSWENVFLWTYNIPWRPTKILSQKTLVEKFWQICQRKQQDTSPSCWPTCTPWCNNSFRKVFNTMEQRR